MNRRHTKLRANNLLQRTVIRSPGFFGINEGATTCQS